MHEVEGGNDNWLMRILRHEIGHALDNAFGLRRRKAWRRSRSARRRAAIRDIYSPRPASRDFVLHLGHWYAQSHPTEDFAETFAVWLQPRARWRREYAGLAGAAQARVRRRADARARGKPPRGAINRDLIEPLTDNHRTLREHYRRKRARYEIDDRDAYDRRLQARVRQARRRHARACAASTLPAPVAPAARAAADAPLALAPLSGAPCAAHGHPALPRSSTWCSTPRSARRSAQCSACSSAS